VVLKTQESKAFVVVLSTAVPYCPFSSLQMTATDGVVARRS
jgi:hypothetical protein